MSVYRVTEVIGTSTESWEAAARSAVETAAATVRELRVAEVVQQDVTIENGSVTSYPGPRQGRDKRLLTCGDRRL
jgi:flavin-binding protein dodecin